MADRAPRTAQPCASVGVSRTGRSDAGAEAQRRRSVAFPGVTPEEFRAAGYELIDLIADYLEGVGERRIVPDIEPGEVRAMLPEHPPTAPEGWPAVISSQCWPPSLLRKTPWWFC